MEADLAEMGEFQEEESWSRGQIVAHLDAQARTATTGITDVPVPSVQPWLCDLFGTQQPPGPGFRETEQNQKYPVRFEENKETLHLLRASGEDLPLSLLDILGEPWGRS